VSFYVIVRGPLGSGKTTLSARLADRLKAEHIAIDQILEKHHLEEWENGYISESSFLQANHIAASSARPFLRRGTPVVIDGNFYWRSAVDDLLRCLPFPHVVFTLKVPLSTCIARDGVRSPPHGAEAAREVYAKTISFDYGVPVDASGSVEETVELLWRELKRQQMPEV